MIMTRSTPIGQPASVRVKRTTVSTILAAVFVWTGIGALRRAWDISLVPEAQVYQYHVPSPTLEVLWVLCAFAAGALAYGLWRVAAWTPRAVIAFGVVALGLNAWQTLADYPGLAWWLIPTSLLLGSAVTYWIHRYAVTFVGERSVHLHHDQPVNARGAVR